MASKRSLDEDVSSKFVRSLYGRAERNQRLNRAAHRRLKPASNAWFPCRSVEQVTPLFPPGLDSGVDIFAS